MENILNEMMNEIHVFFNIRHRAFSFSNRSTVQKLSVFLGHSSKEGKTGSMQGTRQQNSNAETLGRAIELLHGLFE
jgi:hypothetical protein